MVVTGTGTNDEMRSSDQAQQKGDCVNNYKCFEDSELQRKNTRGVRRTFRCSQEDSKQDLHMKG